MKGKTLVLSLAAIMLVIANSVASLAYFTDSDSSTSTFTLGKVKIQAIPTYVGYDASGEIDDTACTITSSGKSCVRTVAVKNTSTVPVYIMTEVNVPKTTTNMVLYSEISLFVNGKDVTEKPNSSCVTNTSKKTIECKDILSNIVMPGETNSAVLAYTVKNISEPIVTIDIDDLEEGSSIDSTDLGISAYIYAIQADGFASAAEAFANY